MPNQVEQATSKIMGAAKAVKGTLKGLTGVFRTLMEEHGEVSALLMRVKSSSDADVRQRLFPTIRRELLAHEKGEMTVLYPALRAHPETRHIADQHDGEGPALEATIDRLHRMDYADPQWDEAFTQLVALVQKHVMEEESEWFPAAHRVLGNQADALDDAYKAAKSEAASHFPS